MRYPAILALIYILSLTHVSAYNNISSKVIPIAEWKNKIFDELSISKDDKKLIQSINIMECGEENGFCLSTHNADAWPLQINQINKEDHKYSEYLVNQWLIAKKNSIKTNDWTTTIAIRNTLYKFQVNWIIARIKQFDKKQCKTVIWINRVRCQAILHNWNNKNWFKYNYAAKAVSLYKQL